MQVYSNVFVHEETGDLLGYELAIKRNEERVFALFYVYEGGVSDEGVTLSGKFLRSRLSVEGTWVEHLRDSSEHEIVQTHFVKITGGLNSTTFRGKVSIEGLAKNDPMRLKRVKQIWFCKK